MAKIKEAINNAAEIYEYVRAWNEIQRKKCEKHKLIEPCVTCNEVLKER
tara:strand:+ start:1292 stop:1438 length:147 start_codon:yes stop_codon:yes gene_type:complete